MNRSTIAIALTLSLMAVESMAVPAGPDGTKIAASAPAGVQGENDLSQALRALLLKYLPTPLYENTANWGKRKEFRELRIRRGKAAWEDVPKNDGVWKKIRLTAVAPEDSIELRISDLSRIDPSAMSFQIFAACNVRLEAAQEQWESGIKLYGVSLRARARIWIRLRCEASTRAEIKNLLPEFVCKVHIDKSEVGYDGLVVEHIAGLGGDAAKVVGVTGVKLIHDWKPSIERHLLDKANSAILKAGQDKEIRLNFGKLLSSK